MGRFSIVIVALALAVFAVIDCAQTPRPSVRHAPKWLWIIGIVVLPVVGPAAWLLLGRGRSGGGSAKPAPPVVAPEDDPEFLRQLRDIDEEHEELLEQWEKDLRRREGELRGDDGDDSPATS